MSGEYNVLIRPSLIDDPVSANKNGMCKSTKSVRRSRSKPSGSKRSSFRRSLSFKSAKYEALGFQKGNRSATDQSSEDDDATREGRTDRIERMLKFLGVLPFFMIIEKAKHVKVINALQELKQRLTSANGRVKQHEAKLRRILSKLGQLDLDVYDLEDPDDVQLLHQNWKDLYDEIDMWLGGPEAASDSSDTECQKE